MASCCAVDEKKIKATYLNSTEDRENKLKLFGFQKKNFIYVGRLSKEKNIDILLNAFNNIKDKGKDWGLIIVGDGPYRESLENIVRKEKIKDVFLPGENHGQMCQFIMLCRMSLSFRVYRNHGVLWLMRQ